MSFKTVRIAELGVSHDYRTSLVPLIIGHLGYRVEWCSAICADLVIYGSFYDVNTPRLRWLPRKWRKQAGSLVDTIDRQLSKRKTPPITLFHTGENLRYDHINADFAISHDLDVRSAEHFRLPYWMELVDWSHEGLIGNRNPRYGELLKLERLRAPLGDQFLKRNQKAVLITSHMREPRASCLEALQQIVTVDGMGPYFNKDIKCHNTSDFLKKDILQKYAFNLCPENGIYPGYVTEKIPEAFAAGCLPITLADEAINTDFNSKAFINLASINKNNFKQLDRILKSKKLLESYAHQPLVINSPNILGFKDFIKNIIMNAIS
jgi:hypothetical protein